MNSYLYFFTFITTISAKFTGSASYNTDSTGFGKCSIPANSYAKWTSVGPASYLDAKACGQCAEIKNVETGAVTIAHVVDQCLGCGPGDLNLSVAAFSDLGQMEKGLLTVQWDWVRCPDVSGPIQYVWQQGSNQWYGAFQILNHAEGIQSVEVGSSINSTFIPLEHRGDNYFVIKREGPFTLKLTSVTGKVILDADLSPLEAGGIVKSSNQF